MTNTVAKTAVEFQSTPPHGERPLGILGYNEQTDVSIHAPARGATYLAMAWIKIANKVSIHAPARGATLERPVRIAGYNRFQSTPPHGERPI